MATIRGLKVLLFLGIFMFFVGKGSVSYAQALTDTGTRVGIGTDSPKNLLHISGVTPAVRIEDSVDGLLGFIGNANDLVSGVSAGVLAIRGETGVVFSSGGRTPRMTIKSGGNVGIGTTNPNAKLHVAGDVIVDGNIGAKYQDVAEWVPTSSFINPGTLVVIDPQETNHVLPSSQAYDTRIAGVVSSRPGILLGEAGEDKVKVAHSGRVKASACVCTCPTQKRCVITCSGSRNEWPSSSGSKTVSRSACS